jgi:tetratricopeptide (TPR) repeat protein
VELTQAGQRPHTDLLMLLGEVLVSAGRATEAEAVYQRAHDDYTNARNLVAAAHADAMRATVLGLLARMDAATALIDRAVEVLEQYPPGTELFDAYANSAMFLTIAGLHRQAVLRADMALSLVERLQSPPADVIARALQARGMARGWLGDRAGELDLLEALELADAHNLTTQLINATLGMANMKLASESALAGVPYNERAFQLATDRGRLGAALFGAGQLAECLTAAGRIDDALAVCARAATVLTDTDSPRDAIVLRLNWSAVHVLRGDAEQARALIAQALPAARGSEPGLLVDVLLVAISCARTDGNDNDVADLTAELVHTLQDEGADADLSQYLRVLARVLCPVGHRDLVARIIDNTHGGVRLVDNNILSARAFLAETDGAYAEALDLWEQADAGWAMYGFPLERAHSLLGAARCCRAVHRPALEMLLEAREILARLGARPLLAEVDGLMNQLGASVPSSFDE